MEGQIKLDTRCLQRGTVIDCGCVIKVKPGQRFGKLTAVEPTGEILNGSAVWRCQYDCGGELFAPLRQLTAGYRKSCGCLQSETYRDNLKLIDGTSVTILEAGKHRLLFSNTSGHTGVYRKRKSGKWAAQITFKGKTYCLGAYAHRQDAVHARERGEEMHDDFLAWYYANFPPKPEALAGHDGGLIQTERREGSRYERGGPALEPPRRHKRRWQREPDVNGALANHGKLWDCKVMGTKSALCADMSARLPDTLHPIKKQ